MITIEKISSFPSFETENERKSIDQIKQAFKKVEDSLVEELKISAELQAKSVVSAMTMPSDSIY